MAQFIPQKGDFITLTFDPQSGHEQKGCRPAIVVSNTLFNKKTGLAIVCPITNTERKFPFHLKIFDSKNITGFAMVDQVKSLDFKSRKAKFIERASSEFLDEVLAVIDACLYE